MSDWEFQNSIFHTWSTFRIPPGIYVLIDQERVQIKCTGSNVRLSM